MLSGSDCKLQDRLDCHNVMSTADKGRSWLDNDQAEDIHQSEVNSYWLMIFPKTSYF